MKNLLKRFTPVIVKKENKYYVGYINACRSTIWSGTKYVVIIGNDHIKCKYEDIIEISNKEFLIVEDKNE